MSVMRIARICNNGTAAPGAAFWRAARTAVLAVLIAGLMASGSGPAAAQSVGRPGSGGARTGVQPAAAWTLPEPTEPMISVEPAMLGCGMGAAAGAMFVAFYPLSKWAKDAGALPGMGAVLFRSLLGCSYGLVGGLTYSVGNSTLAFLDRTFADVF